MATSNIQLIVTDLDDTLWNWFDTWYSGFSALIDSLVEESGLPRDVLLDEARAVHQERGTSEYSFLVDEMPSLRAMAAPELPRDRFSRSIHRQNSARLHSIRLFPEVRESLERLKLLEIPVVAYTESQSFWTLWRMKKLGLDGLIKTIYSSPDHPFPLGLKPEDVRRYPESEYRLMRTKLEDTPEGVLKPSPEILSSILASEGVEADRCLYVGDSLMKDVAMALETGVVAVFAEYGSHRSDDQYDLLRWVTHWQDSDVAREAEMDQDRTVIPDLTLRESFAEILDHV